MDLKPANIQVNEIKSPSTQSLVTGRHCVECGWKLGINEIYCQSCGKNTSAPSRTFSPRKQWIIDRPNTGGMLILSAVVLGIFLFFVIIGFISSFFGAETSIEITGGFIFLAVIAIIIGGIIIGQFIDSIYSDYQSFKSRYNRLAESIETNFLVSITIAFLTLFIYAIVIGNSSANTGDGPISLTLFVLLILPTSYIMAMIINGKPDNLSYFQLLQIKQGLTDKGAGRLINFNKYFVPALTLASPSWHYLIFLNFKVTFLPVAVSGIAFFLIVLFLGNAIFYARENSWKQLVKLVKK